MFKKLLTCFGAGLLVMFALAQQQSQNPTAVVALDTMFYGAVQATVPTNAKMSSIAETFPTGRRVITTAMQGAPSLTTDKYTIEFHFSNGKAVVASLGQAPQQRQSQLLKGMRLSLTPVHGLS